MDPDLTDLLKNRHSCRHFTGEGVSDKQVRHLLEAARWAPSARNDQPWNFIVALRSNHEAFERMLGCLFEGNREWAEHAGCLMICLAPQKYYYNGKPSRWGWHDMGLAIMAMAVQGVSMGLQMREMGGIERDRIRELYEVPTDIDIIEGLAIGVPADTHEARERQAGRSRRAIENQVYEGKWGNPCWA